jgi:hypothetical protein
MTAKLVDLPSFRQAEIIISTTTDARGTRTNGVKSGVAPSGDYQRDS